MLVPPDPVVPELKLLMKSGCPSCSQAASHAPNQPKAPSGSLTIHRFASATSEAAFGSSEPLPNIASAEESFFFGADQSSASRRDAHSFQSALIFSPSIKPSRT